MRFPAVLSSDWGCGFLSALSSRGSVWRQAERESPDLHRFILCRCDLLLSLALSSPPKPSPPSGILSHVFVTVFPSLNLNSRSAFWVLGFGCSHSSAASSEFAGWVRFVFFSQSSWLSLGSVHLYPWVFASNWPPGRKFLFFISLCCDLELFALQRSWCHLLLLAT